MRVWLALLPCLFASTAFAQKIVVRKVHGSQATVEITEGRLEAGDEFDLAPSDPSTSTVGETASAKRTDPANPAPVVEGNTAPASSPERSRLLGLSLNLSSLNSSAPYGKSTANNYGASFRYGWNSEGSEYGFIAALQFTDKGTGLATTATGGLFYDWNWVPNRPGETFVYGLGLQAQYGATNLPGDNGTSTTLFVEPAFFGKWFFLGNATAFRVDVGYSYADDSSTGEKVQITGLNAQGGLAVYF